MLDVCMSPSSTRNAYIIYIKASVVRSICYNRKNVQSYADMYVLLDK